MSDDLDVAIVGAGFAGLYMLHRLKAMGLRARVIEAGGIVHWCRTAAEARTAILKICKQADARTVTKGKSMIGEEIAINEHLEAHGVEPVETDLGEYIIQPPTARKLLPTSLVR